MLAALFLSRVVKFLQYEEFLAYVFVDAGSLYCLLKRIKAGHDRKKVMPMRQEGR